MCTRPGGPQAGGAEESSEGFSGPGPDVLNQKFYQQGLGLFISRLLKQMHLGEPRRGSRFVVRSMSDGKRREFEG